MESTRKITKVTLSTLLLFVTLITQAQLSDLHYLPPLKQKANGIANQLIYLSTPNTTPFTVNVYKGTSTTFTSGATLDTVKVALLLLCRGCISVKKLH